MGCHPLHAWPVLDERQYLTSGITLLARDDHAVTSTTTHFTPFALLGETLRAYLPLVLKR